MRLLPSLLGACGNGEYFSFFGKIGCDFGLSLDIKGKATPKCARGTVTAIKSQRVRAARKINAKLLRCLQPHSAHNVNDMTEVQEAERTQHGIMIFLRAACRARGSRASTE